jgi:hypothetical protein
MRRRVAAGVFALPAKNEDPARFLFQAKEHWQVRLHRPAVPQATATFNERSQMSGKISSVFTECSCGACRIGCDCPVSTAGCTAVTASVYSHPTVSASS